MTEQFIFHDYGLADFDGNIEFFPPAKSSSTHFSPVKRYSKNTSNSELVKAPVHSLTTICSLLEHDHVDLLKIDIEGGEYAVIDDILKSGIVIKQLLVEFHHMFKTIDAINKLYEAGFELFHISDRTYEYSFRLKR